METVKNIEEILKDGKRELILSFNTKDVLLNESNFLQLLLKFGSIKTLKDYFINSKFDDIEYYLKKNNIIYEITC